LRVGAGSISTRGAGMLVRCFECPGSPIEPNGDLLLFSFVYSPPLLISKIMRYLNSNLCTFSVTRLLKEATYQKEHCNESQGTNLYVVHCHSSFLHRLLPAPEEYIH